MCFYRVTHLNFTCNRFNTIINSRYDTKKNQGRCHKKNYTHLRFKHKYILISLKRETINITLKKYKALEPFVYLGNQYINIKHVQ